MTDHHIFLWTLIFTIIYTTVSVIAIVIAFRQIRMALVISTREKGLEAYQEFSAQYAQLARLSHDMDVRFHKQDKSLSEYDIKYFFNNFWVLLLQEWEFYQAGILPVRIFTQWMLHTHEYLLSEKTKRYFVGDEVAEISAKQGFETFGLRVLRFHPDFVAFVRELETIPFTPDSIEAFAPIEALVRKYKKDESYWQI